MPIDEVPRPGRGRRALVAGAVVALASLSFVSCGSSGSSSSSSSADPTGTTAVAGSEMASEPVVKDVLAEDVSPPGAPGYTLTLIRYTIAPGAQLAPHVHPGVQMASIDSGTLSYTIVTGTAQVRRGGGEAAAVTGPVTITLDAGDSVVEPFDMVHFGANDTEEPVIISATLLTESDLGLSVAVTTTTTTAAP